MHILSHIITVSSILWLTSTYQFERSELVGRVQLLMEHPGVVRLPSKPSSPRFMGVVRFKKTVKNPMLNLYVRYKQYDNNGVESLWVIPSQAFRLSTDSRTKSRTEYSDISCDIPLASAAFPPYVNTSRNGVSYPYEFFIGLANCFRTRNHVASYRMTIDDRSQGFVRYYYYKDLPDVSSRLSISFLLFSLVFCRFV